MTYVYFIGIGGAGMSALARYYQLKGYNVSGYDRSHNMYTDELEQIGIPIHYTDDTSWLSTSPMKPENTLAIYTPAIPHDHLELCYLREHGYRILKRAEALGEIAKGYQTLAVAGSHGKTTTTNMLAHILDGARRIGCTAFIGGLAVESGSNFIYSNHSALLVVEADEYDRSFLHLDPYMAIVTSTDADHLDIYGNYAGYLAGFEAFCGRVKPGGTLLLKEGLPIRPRLAEGVLQLTYGNTPKADVYYDHVTVREGRICFDWHYPQEGVRLDQICLGVPVRTNLENATSAMAIAYLNGVSSSDLVRGIESFRGTKRRFELVLQTKQHLLIDDYAHHPVELDSAIHSIKEIYGSEDVLVIFQPHLYSRTADFYHQFAESLSHVDQVVVLDIYPAREEPIEGVTSKLIYDELTAPHRWLCTKNELLPLLQRIKLPRVILTVGAGDIDKLVLPIRDYLATL
jgi:UDP-N-acetylmuramate--L-alanine ligase